MKANKSQTVKNENVNVVINNTTSVNMNVISKRDAKAKVLALLSKEVSLTGFVKLMQQVKEADLQAYKDLLFAHNLSETFEFSFDWFKENTPTINGKFAYWKKVTDNQPANESAEFNRINQKSGTMYTLVEYNVYKANYSVFLNMFSNTVNEINRRKRAELAEVNKEKKAESEVKKAIKAKKDAFKKMSAEEKLAYMNSLTDEEKIELLSA